MKNKIKNNVIIILFLTFILLGIAFAGLIYFDNNMVRQVDISGFRENSNDIQFNIDYINNERNNAYISIQGWAIKPGSNISTVECYVGIMNTKKNKYYKVNTMKEERADVTSYFNDGFDYDNSGFYAQFPKKKLVKGNYEIFLLYQNDNNYIFVPTGKSILIP